jgi:uncharacterized membrane protein YidH (DUF202 family)
VLELLATAAEGGEETSKAAFYIAGSALTAFAVVIAALGIRAHGRFPPTRGVARAVMGLAVVLVAATMATAVLTG